jgi:hypothetical protein
LTRPAENGINIPQYGIRGLFILFWLLHPGRSKGRLPGKGSDPDQ